MSIHKILMITEWGVGIDPLFALKKSLIQYGFDVDLINIFDAFDPEKLSFYTEKAKHYDVLLGWSLGGQLATILAEKVYQCTGQLKILLTLASNPCFVAQESWQEAMPEVTFLALQQAFHYQPTAALQRFCYLITDGDYSSKQDWLVLQSLVKLSNPDLLQQGLLLLKKLNMFDILQKYPGRQYHLFFKQDSLVSYKVKQKIQNIPAKFLETELINGSHAQPIFNVSVVSYKIMQYLNKNFDFD